jgi:low temperature requirement protein LtrA
MCVLAVLAVFVGSAGGADGTAFSLTYAVLLVLLSWQWYEVRRRDLPEHRSTSTPYLVGLGVTIAAMVATAWLPDDARVGVWWCVVLGWVVLGAYGFVSRDRALQFFQATDSLIERMALFVIIVLGETVAGVVNGITATGWDAAKIITGVLGLCIGFGVWWNYFDIVGAREPRDERPRAAAWFFSHLPQCGAIAVAGAAMIGLVTDAHATRTPAVVAWTLGGAVAVSLVLVAVQSATVRRDAEELGSRTLVVVFGAGAALVLVLAAVAPRPWVLALLVIAVLSATWLLTFVPPSSAADPDAADN